MAKKRNISAYQQKLLDPRWQKKRLEILQRDNWTCQACEDRESTLHVHHRYYEKGRDPWDYPNEALVTVCADCHDIDRLDRPEHERRLMQALQRHLWWYEVEWLAMVFEDMPTDVARALAAGAVRWDEAGRAEQWLREQREKFAAWLKAWDERHPEGAVPFEVPEQ